MEKTKVNMDPKYIIKLTVTLFATCVVVAGLLGGVNAITADKIAEINWQKTVKAMKEVVADPENTTFSDALPENADAVAAAAAAGATLGEVYEVQVSGASAGYAIKVIASGSQGSIEMMVGVDGDNAVTGVSVVKHAETKGIGTKVIENEPNKAGVGALTQFEGKTPADAPLSIGAGGIDAITGATVSSKGVTTGVNAALAAAAVLG